MGRLKWKSAVVVEVLDFCSGIVMLTNNSVKLLKKGSLKISPAFVGWCGCVLIVPKNMVEQKRRMIDRLLRLRNACTCRFIKLSFSGLHCCVALVKVSSLRGTSVLLHIWGRGLKTHGQSDWLLISVISRVAQNLISNMLASSMPPQGNTRRSDC